MTFAVVKVGGSLFDVPDLRARLKHWLDSQESPRRLLIAGGGRLAEIVRWMYQRHQISDECAHWLAIETMHCNGMVLAELCNSCLVATRDEAEVAWQRRQDAILDPRPFCQSNDCGLVLPHSWDVTSDSIAAQVATSWCGARLVLLKSRPPPESLDDWSSTGYCDRWFNRVVAGSNIQIEAINLREGTD